MHTLRLSPFQHAVCCHVTVDFPVNLVLFSSTKKQNKNNINGPKSQTIIYLLITYYTLAHYFSQHQNLTHGLWFLYISFSSASCSYDVFLSFSTWSSDLNRKQIIFNAYSVATFPSSAPPLHPTKGIRDVISLRESKVYKDIARDQSLVSET